MANCRCGTVVPILPPAPFSLHYWRICKNINSQVLFELGDHHVMAKYRYGKAGSRIFNHLSPHHLITNTAQPITRSIQSPGAYEKKFFTLKREPDK
jgi:hypothetical protein